MILGITECAFIASLALAGGELAIAEMYLVELVGLVCDRARLPRTFFDKEPSSS